MWAVGRLIRKEPKPIFTRWGVVGNGIGNATQAACVPARHIVEEVPGCFGAAGFEDFLLPANGEPLGAPVCSIFEQSCPFVGLFTLVVVNEVGA
jgi:hypothetical protein